MLYWPRIRVAFLNATYPKRAALGGRRWPRGNVTYVTLHRMSRGESGRIVIEVDPALKRRLYKTLALSGSTLKDWFVQAADRFCDDAVQRDLFSNDAESPDSRSKSSLT